ncbi:MAG: transcription antitermination factor NusB [Deltaproteobacteria bacterium]|nr:transcription antitermination factor NusB [Deltaproteobacteria bacterium]
MGTHGPRRMAREAALQVLFAADHVHPELEVEAARSAFEEVCEEFKLPRRTHVRALELAVGVARNRKDIDLAIGRASENWKVERLAAVDRAVLRIATYELLHEPETPPEVVIDEAVEIARRFGGERSPAFVNGVLDVIARQVHGARESRA